MSSYSVDALLVGNDVEVNWALPSTFPSSMVREVSVKLFDDDSQRLLGSELALHPSATRLVVPYQDILMYVCVVMHRFKLLSPA